MHAFDAQPAGDAPPTLRVVRYDEPAQHAPHTLQSPSLLRRAASVAPAHELKLLLDENQASAVEARLRPLLALDPHVDFAHGNSYQLTTLYCDTPQLDVFHRRGRYRLFKFRLRRYGDAPQIYLERKSKRKTQVRKRRTAIELGQVDRFDSPQAGRDWDGAWYHSQLLRNQFRPVCLIEYDRVAYFGDGGDGPIRLTFDRQIRGGLTSAWSFAPASDSRLLLPNQVVCEFKYRGSLPAVFKGVLSDLQLTPCGVSKYRHCLQAAGIELEPR